MQSAETVKIDLVNRALGYLTLTPITSLTNNITSEPVQSVLLNFQPVINRVLSSYVFSWSYKIIKLTQYNDDYKGYIIPTDMITYLGIGDSMTCCCGKSSLPNFLIDTHKFNISIASVQIDASRNFETRLQIQSCCLEAYCYEYLHYISSENDYDQLRNFPYLEEYIVCELALALAPKLLTAKSNLHQLITQRYVNARNSAFRHETISYTNNNKCPFIPFYSIKDNRTIY